MGTTERTRLGVGIGWRPEIDITVERLDVDFVEVIAENVNERELPESLRVLRERGTTVLPHGVSLSLGGPDELDLARVRHLGALASALDAPVASDHICFTRAGELDAGHLLPLPRTYEALDVLVRNIVAVQAELAVPFAVENIAALFAWPDAELTEAQFLTELLTRTGCLLILDVANLHANARNLGADPIELFEAIPLDRIAYVHIAGGRERAGLYHDTHTDPVPAEVLELLAELHRRARPPGVLLERDGNYPPDREIAAELAAIRSVVDAR